MILKVALSRNEFKKHRFSREPLKDLTIAILAGGQASRMGQSKIFIRYKNKPLIAFPISLAKELSSQIIFITRNLPVYFSHSLNTYRDIYPGKGPLGGIYTALYYSKTRFIASLPCDMPFLTPTLYQILYKNRSHHHPTVLKSVKGIESLLSIWPRELLGKLKYHLDQNNLKLYQVIKELNAKEISVEFDKKIFLNLNTTRDLEKLFQENEE
jgi:molybdopterin-guanine dinucleotide biosynthesis protein A